jgi:hypothetical protein
MDLLPNLEVVKVCHDDMNMILLLDFKFYCLISLEGNNYETAMVNNSPNINKTVTSHLKS